MFESVKMKVFYTLLLKILVLVCLAEITAALDCLSCSSSEVYSQCTLGQRRGRPRLSNCGPDSRCYAIAQIHDNISANFERGCTIDPDFCDYQDDVDYCQTCGSQLCNYWPMDISEEAVEYLGQEEPIETTTTRRPKKPARRIVVRPLFNLHEE